ncbi:MAG TPA: hypothetical protein VF050_10890 [Moraxellaceae bacterium]
MPRKHHDLLIGLLLLGLLALNVWTFFPGLGGRFIFDDLPNLLPWSALGDIDSFSKLQAFIFSSKFLPGRPLALLSFLVDDQSWPPSVYALKASNLALHLVNICLVFWLSSKLLARMLPEQSRNNILLLSLGVAAIWGLHPMQVSTVSYIIQRMCLLSTTFSLIALLLFMQGREQLELQPRRALALCSLGIGLFVPLAILTKETGLLICAFALLIEHFCFVKNNTTPWRLWRLLFLSLPLLLFLVYCLITYRFFTVGFQIRDFNALERLLTQGPVLVDYLHKLVLPTFNSGSLFYDNFPVSRSLIQPPATLLAWLFIAGLLALAWKIRQRHPAIAFGLLFYFCGHLMESTVLPLEIYFEHRNYLPQLGLWIALAGAVSLLGKKSLKAIAGTALALWFLLLVFISHNNAWLWGNPDLQAAAWYKSNPGSLRTTLVYVNALMRSNQAELLEQTLAQGRRDFPGSMNLLLTQRIVACFGRNQPTRFDDLPGIARHADYDNSLVSTLHNLSQQPVTRAGAANGCIAPPPALIAATYKGLLANAAYKGSWGTIYQYLGEMAQSARDTALAASCYQQAFRYNANPIYAFRAAQQLALLDRQVEALQYLAETKRTLSWRDRMMNPDFPERIRKAREKLAVSKAGTAE